MKNIFVGNLDFAATESSIRTLFEAHGKVDRVSLVTDRDTGRPRGFAFVEMSDSGEADRAIAALNGTELGGRKLNINEARPKGEGGGGGRGGAGGGGPQAAARAALVRSFAVSRPGRNCRPQIGAILMGMRSGTTFKKRQKEIARMEKQRDKFARRLQRKTEKLTGPPVDDMGEPVGDLSEPDVSGPKDDLDREQGAVSMPAE